jgi:hypothetical protein
MTSLREAVASAPDAASIATKLLDYVVSRLEADPGSAETFAAELKANRNAITEALQQVKADNPPASPSAQAKPTTQQQAQKPRRSDDDDEDNYRSKPAPHPRKR